MEPTPSASRSVLGSNRIVCRMVDEVPLGEWRDNDGRVPVCPAPTASIAAVPPISRQRRTHLSASLVSRSIGTMIWQGAAPRRLPLSRSIQSISPSDRCIPMGTVSSGLSPLDCPRTVARSVPIVIMIRVIAFARALVAAAWVTVLLLTAALPTIIATFRATLLPHSCRHHLQRLHRISRIITGNHQITRPGQLFRGDVTNDDRKARTRMQHRREGIVDQFPVLALSLERNTRNMQFAGPDITDRDRALDPATGRYRPEDRRAGHCEFSRRSHTRHVHVPQPCRMTGVHGDDTGETADGDGLEPDRHGDRRPRRDDQRIACSPPAAQSRSTTTRSRLSSGCRDHYYATSMAHPRCEPTQQSPNAP